MNLDELRAVQDREREKDSLQHLRDSFYSEVGQYIGDLRAERERQAERAEDPFADAEVRRLTDEIETAEEVAESIYERRMGKVVKTASLAAAGYRAETEGLTAEESDLFDDLVDRIEDNQETVLDVLSGEDGAGPPGDAESPLDRESGGPPVVDDGPPEPPSPPDAAPTGDAASDGDEDEAGDGEDDADRPPAEAVAATAPDDSGESSVTAAGEDTASDDGSAAGGEAADDLATDAAAAMGSPDRVTVRITADVGEIVGVDGTAYDLEADDVVTLPEENAMPLVEKDAATRVE
ncbi:DNA replication complex subunit Gins51 [Salinarchaeum chitinilyticum]